MTEVPIEAPVCKLVDSGSVNISHPPTRRERKRVYAQLPWGAVPGYAPLCWDGNDPATVTAGYMKRLLRDMPEPKPWFLPELTEFVKANLHYRAARHMTYEEWRAGANFPEWRLKQYDRANDLNHGCAPPMAVATQVHSFAKVEYYLDWKHLRTINAPCDRAKAWMAPYLKAVEEVVYEDDWFIKHIPVASRPAAIAAQKKAGRLWYATDFSSFEAGINSDLMKACEHQLYKHCLNWWADVDKMCRVLGGYRNFSMRNGIKLRLKGRRCSGDMCTSLGNGFTNMMVTRFIVHRKGGQCGGFVEGDDGLFWSTVPLSVRDYEDCGFLVKQIDSIDDPCKASFCSLVFSEDGTILKDPRKVLCGFGWTHSDIHAGTKVKQGLLRAKALSLLEEADQCPILGQLAREAERRTRGVETRFVPDGYHVAPKENRSPGVFKPSLAARVLFAETFGVSIATQEACERVILSGDLTQLAILLPPPEPVSRYAQDYVTR